MNYDQRMAALTSRTEKGHDEVVVRRAYASCLRLARTHYENFPVASGLLPAASRPHIAAVYAFARVADDFADEGDLGDDVRLTLLDRWADRLRRAADGGVASQAVDSLDEAVDHPDADDIFRALGNTMQAHDLPLALFEDLLSAFRQDVTVHRYDSWDDLLDYCRRSANPIGRIVLRITGYRDAALDRASDAVCSALQITNFLQDFGRDWRAGRLYVPTAIQRESGARSADLDHGALTPEWREALERCAERTRTLFLAGRPVCDGVAGRLRLELRLTWLGGMRILDRLGRAGYDPLTNRPTLGLVDALPLVWRALVWT